MNDYNNVLLMSIVSNHCNMSPEDLGYVTRGNFFCNLQGNAFCRVASCRQAILPRVAPLDCNWFHKYYVANCRESWTASTFCNHARQIAASNTLTAYSRI